MKLVCTRERSIGRFACGCLKENKYARKSLRTRSENTAVELGKDAKLKELEWTDCENYFYYRHKSIKVKQVTVQNEQSTINALMKWLNKNGDTHIDSFEFKKLPRLDKGNEAIRRATMNTKHCVVLCVPTVPNTTR